MRKFKSFLVNVALLALLAVVLVAWIQLTPLLVGLLVLALVLWLLLTRRGRQTLSVTRVGISTLGQRLGASSVIVIGIAGVVGVLVAMLAMGDGFASTLRGDCSLGTQRSRGKLGSLGQV
ncbi:MAG: hypothetical protein WDW36_005858 [Sanguina aurantia]